MRSAGISLGWYWPSMSYWNSTYFPEQQWTGKFTGNALLGAFLEFRLYRDLRARLGCDYWKETVHSGDIPIPTGFKSHSLTTSLTSFSFDLLYELSFLRFSKFSPYAGLGGSYVFVGNKMATTAPAQDETINQQGQDFTGNITLGIERPLVAGFTAAIEFKYIFGKYTQGFPDASGNNANENISLSGPQAGIKLFYVFN